MEMVDIDHIRSTSASTVESSSMIILILYSILRYTIEKMIVGLYLFFVHRPGYSTGEISLETSMPYHDLQIHQDGYGKATKTIYIYFFV
jgi:hypothetical protein